MDLIFSTITGFTAVLALHFNEVTLCKRLFRFSEWKEVK
jgi:hypothetical protein